MYEELVKRLLDISNSDSNIKSNYIGLTMKQAADIIEELSREYESIEKSLTESVELVRKLQSSRWIPITKRLPDYPGRFMCYYEVNDYGENGYCIDWGMYDPDDGWYVSGVTHWMPLPEPPKEEV